MRAQVVLCEGERGFGAGLIILSVGLTIPGGGEAHGLARFTHRTETVDYAILLSGEIDLELENGEVVHLKPGDVVVQRGTTHTWAI